MFRFKPLINLIALILNYLNTSYVSVQVYLLSCSTQFFQPFKYILCFGSSYNRIKNNIEMWIFKYILCFGSRVGLKQRNEFQMDLNTSYVSVQVVSIGALIVLLGIFKYILCFGSSGLIVKIENLLKKFKYILCFGSS